MAADETAPPVQDEAAEAPTHKTEAAQHGDLPPDFREQRLDPLIHQLGDLCHQHGLPCIIAVQMPCDADHDLLLGTTYVPDNTTISIYAAARTLNTDPHILQVAEAANALVARMYGQDDQRPAGLEDALPLYSRMTSDAPN